MQQAGNAAARKATERALATASKEGSVGIVKVRDEIERGTERERERERESEWLAVRTAKRHCF